MNTSTPNIYTLSLHDALPIFPAKSIFNNLYASLAQAENKQTSSCVHCHILLAIHRICHRTRLNRRTNGCLPKQLAAPGVKGTEISLASPAEQQIQHRRQEADLRY